MRVLELFSGTGSVGKVARRLGHEVISLDRDMPADIRADITTWDYQHFQPHHFDLITASPVCAPWSKLKNCHIGRNGITRASIQHDIDTIGKPMVDRVREIIDYLKPRYWWIENPRSSRMKDYISDLPYFDVSYCKYSSWGYQKHTRIWTNIVDFTPKFCRKDCRHIVPNTKRHTKTLGNGYAVDASGASVLINTAAKRRQLKNSTRETPSNTTKLARYRIPAALIEDLLAGCAPPRPDISELLRELEELNLGDA